MKKQTKSQRAVKAVVEAEPIVESSAEPIELGELLTEAEMLARLRCKSRVVAWRLRKAGLRHIRLNGKKTIRYFRDDVERLIRDSIVVTTTKG